MYIVQCRILAEIVAALSKSLLVFDGKDFFGQAIDVLAIPQNSNKVFLFLAAISTERTGTYAVCIWKIVFPQRDQVILQCGLYFGILLAAGLQHNSKSLLWDISRQCGSVVKGRNRLASCQPSYVLDCLKLLFL